MANKYINWVVWCLILTVLNVLMAGVLAWHYSDAVNRSGFVYYWFYSAFLLMAALQNYLQCSFDELEIVITMLFYFIQYMIFLLVIRFVVYKTPCSLSFLGLRRKKHHD